MVPPFTWVPYSGDSPPPNMVKGGHRTSTDDLLYVCRGTIDGVSVAGKFYPPTKLAYFPYAGKEHKQSTCEILCCDEPDLLQWVPASNGETPDAIVFVGYERSGLLYVARAMQGSELIPGKLFPPHKTCYVSTRNEEFSSSDYEVLTYST